LEFEVYIGVPWCFVLLAADFVTASTETTFSVRFAAC
jgi:hypothetical protein